ncbi:uncharacterized protein LOC132730626 [Ruditapes philippinarum]|uniref:uncharacterized protein LOC132730626 n=1 Tax=Ruditapes philippinarum TaxID=129788 RepID=UPI00295BA312|nr:uncharacterized protein LOC132730626 [Ruditapes philippinarum]
MTSAYQAVKDACMPIKTAARQYGVPQTTLRDRVLGRIDPDTVSSGPQALFSQEQEALFVQHLKAMAELGYGYSRTEVTSQASNFALFLGLRDKNHPLSDRWFRGFMDRWPEMKVLKPRALSNYRAQASSKEAISSFFDNLQSVLKDNNLMDSPELIYNVDEKGVQTEHSPPYIVCTSKTTPAITSARSSTTTILACGNAIGSQIPPYFIFKGQRMRSELMEGSSPGAQGTVTDSGWSNTAIFLEYLETHFLKYVQRPNSETPVLLIYDGHKSHINLQVINWAKDHHVILMVLPAHTSHILQPLDVGCFGPLQRIYNSECQKFLRNNPASKITRYNICSLVCPAYASALSVVNLRSSFKRSGIFPFNPAVITDSQLAPSKAYSTPQSESCSSSDLPQPACSTENQNQISKEPHSFFKAAETVIVNKQRFEQKTKNATLSKIVSGKSITTSEIEKQITDHQNEMSSKYSKSKTKRSASGKGKTNKVHKRQKVVASSDSEDSSDVSDDEKCCVCKLFQPKELQNCVSLVFTSWAQCDFQSCNHWTHLKYCCKETVVRTHDVFICPCHNTENTEV